MNIDELCDKQSRKEVSEFEVDKALAPLSNFNAIKKIRDFEMCEIYRLARIHSESTHIDPMGNEIYPQKP